MSGVESISSMSFPFLSVSFDICAEFTIILSDVFGSTTLNATLTSALRKWVTQAIVIENGKETVTQTGHTPEQDQEPIVKVDLNRKKLNKEQSNSDIQ